MILVSRDDFRPAQGLFDWEAIVEKRFVQGVVAVLVLVLVAAVSFTLGQRSGAERQALLPASATHRELIDHYMTLGQEACPGIGLACKSRMTVTEFEEHFGAIKRVDRRELPKSRRDATHLYVHKPSHRVFYLQFDDDALVGAASDYGRNDFEPHLPTIEERAAKTL